MEPEVRRMPAENIEQSLDQLLEWKELVDRFMTETQQFMHESRSDRAGIRRDIADLKEDFRLLGVEVRSSYTDLRERINGIRETNNDIQVGIAFIVGRVETAMKPCEGCPRIEEMIKKGKEVVASLKEQPTLSEGEK
jgi:hypothetical protein